MSAYFSQATQEVLPTIDITPSSVESIIEWLTECHEFENSPSITPADIRPKLKDIHDKSMQSNILAMQTDSPQHSILRYFFALALCAENVLKAMQLLATNLLNEKIQILPQELQDYIFEYAVLSSLPPKHRLIVGTETYEYHPTTQDDLHALVVINSHDSPTISRYVPPTALQVNRKTRAKFAERYCSNTNFYVPAECSIERKRGFWAMLRSKIRHLRLQYSLKEVFALDNLHYPAWLTTLTGQHRNWIKTIKYTLYNPSDLTLSTKTLDRAQFRGDVISFLLHLLGAEWSPSSRPGFWT